MRCVCVCVCVCVTHAHTHTHIIDEAAALEEASRRHPLNGDDSGTGGLLLHVFKALPSPYFEVVRGQERSAITAEYGQGDGVAEDEYVGSIRGNGGAVGGTSSK
ncbi:hypothetical protein FOA52_013160 [Chlamydomonas sp. UWO 241]|nr:hypothetical protein FOA52_013160 [Chlamydomonas sp. UWO 241]